MEDINGDSRIGAATNVGGGEQYNSASSSASELPPQDHFQFPRNDTFGETHPSPLGNKLAHPSPSQNPFQFQSDAVNALDQAFLESALHQPFSVTKQGKVGMEKGQSSTDDMLGLHSSLSPSSYESSPGNPFHVPTNTTSKAPVGGLDPSLFLSSQNQQLTDASDKTHSGETSAKLDEDGGSNYNRKSGSNSPSASDCSDDDFPVSSMPKHGQLSDDLNNDGSAIQNPPTQVMERPEEPGTPSAYRIPSHVFDRTKSNTPEWSTASNESLFSIHMGNMSFSRELNWLSTEIGKPGDMNMPAPPNNNNNDACASNQSPVTKFNDMSLRAGDFQQGVEVTEARAAETMREVIRENTQHHDLSSVSGSSHFDGPSNFHDHSHHSDGSTKSFAFKVMPDGDKSPTSMAAKEKPKQCMQPETQTPRETPNAAQTPKSTTNSSCNRWFLCFSSCR